MTDVTTQMERVVTIFQEAIHQQQPPQPRQPPQPLTQIHPVTNDMRTCV